MRIRTTLGLILTSCLWFAAACMPVIQPERRAQPPKPAQKLAYVSGNQLIITTYPAGKIDTVDTCTPAPNCRFGALRWSPTGAYLSYLKKFTETGDGLFVVDESHTVRAVTTPSATLALAFTPTWSPDGKRLVYLLDTPDVAPLSTEPLSAKGAQVGGGAQRSEVWVSAAPFANGGHKAGDVHILVGCGGGGYTASEQLYWQEGLATWPHGFPDLALAWLPTDVLLFGRTCPGPGIGQFDMKTGREQAPLDPNYLLEFTVDRTGQRLAAVTWDHQIALAQVDGAHLITQSLTAPVQPANKYPVTGTVSAGGVFFGPTSRRLYFTTRRFLGAPALDPDKAMHYLDLYADLFNFSPAFLFYQTTLFAVTDNDFTETKPLVEMDDYGVGSLTEAANGDILYVRIPNDSALMAGIKAEQPVQAVAKLFPRPAIMRLPANGGATEVVVENAGQLALAPP
ncbi:MAG: hypothetical protein U0350_48370 [Caldilineaceae bacterium]